MSQSHREFARAKLTRSFQILGRREDGYHTISSEMVSLEFADELEFAAGNGVELVDAIDWTGDEPIDLRSAIGLGRNLVESALSLVERESYVRLTKRIPPGAGLGGGSADAAAVLRWAGDDEVELAIRLGADVPFCLRGGHALVGGIGEILEQLPPLDASFVLLVPAVTVSTASVYSAFDVLGPARRRQARNDLEEAALLVEPRLARFRDLLREVSGLRPQLAGSGATWFVECTPDDAERMRDDTRSAVIEDGSTAVVIATQTAK